jgi:hypothetical protein
MFIYEIWCEMHVELVGENNYDLRASIFTIMFQLTRKSS